MKKLLIALLMVVLCFSVAACSSKEETPPESNQPESSSNVDADADVDADTNADADVEESEDEAGGMLTSADNGTTGEGPITLDTVFATYDIPAGMQYKINMLPAEGETRGTGDINFGLSDTRDDVRIIVTTMRMVESLDDAVNECLRINNQNDEAIEELGEVTYGGTTYRTISIPGGYSTKFFLIGYYAEGSSDFYIEISAFESDISIDDPAVVQLMNGIQYK